MKNKLNPAIKEIAQEGTVSQAWCKVNFPFYTKFMEQYPEPTLKSGKTRQDFDERPLWQRYSTALTHIEIVKEYLSRDELKQKEIEEKKRIQKLKEKEKNEKMLLKAERQKLKEEKKKQDERETRKEDLRICIGPELVLKLTKEEQQANNMSEDCPCTMCRISFIKMQRLTETAKERQAKRLAAKHKNIRANTPATYAAVASSSLSSSAALASSSSSATSLSTLTLQPPQTQLMNLGDASPKEEEQEESEDDKRDQMLVMNSETWRGCMYCDMWFCGLCMSASAIKSHESRCKIQKEQKDKQQKKAGNQKKKRKSTACQRSKSSLQKSQKKKGKP